MSKREKIYLDFSEMPRSWYNIKADLPFEIDPMMNPQTKKPAKPEELKAIFPPSIIEQEFTKDREIPIPQEVLEEYAVYRPTPLVHATGLEEFLDTPAKIYFKNESVSPGGSHKVNTSLPQAYFNRKDGFKKLTTETGAGQWGTALAYAGIRFGVQVEVFMVKVSYDAKPGRRHMMRLFGAQVHKSPSDLTDCGRKILEKDPQCNGSLGIAISDAVERAVKDPESNYALGSVLDHVLIHQSIIGLETKMQLKKAGVNPDVLIACVGGGSNFGGFALPFVASAIEKKNLRIIASEPLACPTLKKGEFKYDFGDTAHFTPMIMMYTLGSEFVPPPIHAGGLRYHGASPIVSRLVKENIVEADDLTQDEILEAAKIFSITEGIVPAPESSHAIASAIKVALECKREKKPLNIVFNLSGHGFLDLNSYDHIEKLKSTLLD